MQRVANERHSTEQEAAPDQCGQLDCGTFSKLRAVSDPMQRVKGNHVKSLSRTAKGKSSISGNG